MKVPFLRENYLRGVDEGRVTGKEEGREEMIRTLLGGLFAHRVGRRPTGTEEHTLVERAQTLGAEQVEQRMFELEGRALLRWLAKPSAG